ncbi:DUF2474 family protein [Pollutimonas harenae]|uniref:DUF2474 family protein n=1 Tax=Pollutimonas harenae TaxID=657015 RepID=A0A853H690_9BURK|nr:DUF2474 family protein [Pollutimonas harenae]NYT86033.1 DUF2474 family protein [Pollutimonas harenae]TEA71081.1 DUF2474 family protein [Pollutimonas harenae]
MEQVERKRLWAKRLAWMLGIWLASIAALGLAAYLLRLVMNAVGMTA